MPKNDLKRGSRVRVYGPALVKNGNKAPTARVFYGARGRLISDTFSNGLILVKLDTEHVIKVHRRQCVKDDPKKSRRIWTLIRGDDNRFELKGPPMTERVLRVGEIIARRMR